MRTRKHRTTVQAGDTQLLPTRGSRCRVTTLAGQQNGRHAAHGVSRRPQLPPTRGQGVLRGPCRRLWEERGRVPAAGRPPPPSRTENGAASRSQVPRVWSQTFSNEPGPGFALGTVLLRHSAAGRSPGTPPPGPLMPWTPRAPHRAHGLATRCARVCPVSSPESSPISVTHFLLFTFSRGPSRLKMRSSLLESGSPSGCREHREGCVSVRLGFFPLLSCHPAG